MKLYAGEGMGRGSGVCCRQSRLRGVIGGLLVCTFAVGAVLVCRHQGFPRVAWVGGAVVVAVVVAIVLRSVLARFRPTNWVLRVQSDGLWINLRPLQPPTEAQTSLHLRYAEIARANRHIDTWSTPSTKSGSTQWKLESLDLHLASGDTSSLSVPLTEAITASKGLSTSVMVPTPGVIRIAWRGHGHDVVPALGFVLGAIGGHVAVADPTRTDRPDWRKLSDAELDELIDQLVRWGDSMEASELLIRHRGCSATEAHKLLKEMLRDI